MARRTGDRAGVGLRLAAFGVVGFLYFPLAIIILYAFNTQSALFTFPPPGLTTRWFEVALSNPSLWASLRLSVTVAAIATVIALVIGSLLADGRLSNAVLRSRASRSWCCSRSRCPAS